VASWGIEAVGRRVVERELMPRQLVRCMGCLELMYVAVGVQAARREVEVTVLEQPWEG